MKTWNGMTPYVTIGHHEAPTDFRQTSQSPETFQLQLAEKLRTTRRSVIRYEHVLPHPWHD